MMGNQRKVLPKAGSAVIAQPQGEQRTGQMPTHIWWGQDGPQFVSDADEGHYPAGDLTEIPAGTDIEAVRLDPTAREIIEDFTELDRRLCGMVDHVAEKLRQRFGTTLAGQQGIYAAKEMQARDFKAGGAGPWPYLEAEAAARQMPIEELAAEILAAAGASLMPRIEGWRVAAKAKVRAAPNARAKRRACDPGDLIDAVEAARERN